MLKRGELIIRTWYKSIGKRQRNERERWLYLELGDHRKLLLLLRLEEVLFSGAHPCGLLWLLLSVITLHVGRPGLACHSCCGTATDAQSPCGLCYSLWLLAIPCPRSRDHQSQRCVASPSVVRRKPGLAGKAGMG